MKNEGITQIVTDAIKDQRHALGLARMYEGGMGCNEAPTVDQDDKYLARAAINVIYVHELRPLITALQKLACLGNGNIPGNSVGNIIAQGALNKFYEGHQ